MKMKLQMGTAATGDTGCFTGSHKGYRPPLLADASTHRADGRAFSDKGCATAGCSLAIGDSHHSDISVATFSPQVAAVCGRTSKPCVDLNLVRACAVLGVVFYHTLDLFCASRDLKVISHVFLGMPSLTVLLLFSGMTMGIMRMPSNLRAYPGYLRVYALNHLRVYTVFFAIQTAIGIVYYYHVDAGERGIGRAPFDAGSILTAYVLGGGYGSLGIWYMQMLACAVAIWPLTKWIRRVPVWTVVAGLLVISCQAGQLVPPGISYVLSRYCYCVAMIFLGQNAAWLRTGNHRRQGWGFGCLYITASMAFLILFFRGTFPVYQAFPLLWDIGEIPRVMCYVTTTLSRLCGALVFISAVGLIGGRLPQLRVSFGRAAHSSYYIYLMHRVVHYAVPVAAVGFIRSTMLSWGILPCMTAMALGALLLAVFGYCVWLFAHRRPWLDYFVFGKRLRPHSRSPMYRQMQKASSDMGENAVGEGHGAALVYRSGS